MRYLVAFSLLVAVFSSRSFGENSLQDSLDARLRALTKGEVPGVAVLVARDGKILTQGGYGFADLAQKTPITPETKFRICSVTKQFTAAAILRLAEAQQLALTDPLERYFPGFPQPGKITLHHLLTHTSGLHNYTEKATFLSGVEHAVAPETLLTSLREDPLDFAPGAGFHYSNTGYFLLGEIVRKVSGRTFAEYLREQFFAPLGMQNTGIFDNAQPPAGVARGYAFDGEKVQPALDWEMSWAGGAGALYSTVGDLLLWNEALYHGHLLSPEMFTAMTTPVQLPAGVDGMSYGYGLLQFGFHQLPAFGHSGGVNGWSSELLSFPQQHCTVVVLANALPGAPALTTGPLAAAIAEDALAAEIKAQPPLTESAGVDPKTLADFVGRYDYHGAILAVTVENARIFAQLTGQAKFEIFPEGPDRFFWKIADARVRFLRDEKGAVTAAQHTQNGATFQAPRAN